MASIWHATPRRLELAATLVGGITVAVLLVFLGGEVAAGDWTGLQHLVQVVPLIALLALGWRRPALAGALLVAIGAALAAIYFVGTWDSSIGRTEQLLVAALFLDPPLVAGLLFLAASRR